MLLGILVKTGRPSETFINKHVEIIGDYFSFESYVINEWLRNLVGMMN